MCRLRINMYSCKYNVIVVIKISLCVPKCTASFNLCNLYSVLPTVLSQLL